MKYTKDHLPYTQDLLHMGKSQLIEQAAKYVHSYDCNLSGQFELKDLYYVYNMLFHTYKLRKEHCGISCLTNMIEELRDFINKENAKCDPDKDKPIEVTPPTDEPIIEDKKEMFDKIKKIFGKE